MPVCAGAAEPGVYACEFTPLSVAQRTESKRWVCNHICAELGTSARLLANVPVNKNGWQVSAPGGGCQRAAAASTAAGVAACQRPAAFLRTPAWAQRRWRSAACALRPAVRGPPVCAARALLPVRSEIDCLTMTRATVVDSKYPPGSCNITSADYAASMSVIRTRQLPGTLACCCSCMCCSGVSVPASPPEPNRCCSCAAGAGVEPAGCCCWAGCGVPLAAGCGPPGSPDMVSENSPA